MLPILSSRRGVVLHAAPSAPDSLHDGLKELLAQYDIQRCRGQLKVYALKPAQKRKIAHGLRTESVL